MEREASASATATSQSLQTIGKPVSSERIEIRIPFSEVPSDGSEIPEYLNRIFPNQAQIAVIRTSTASVEVFNFLCKHGASHRPLQRLNPNDSTGKCECYWNLLILDK